jgi:ABC-type transporter Mla subunit MlaD
MADIHSIREGLESVQSSVDSASWSADQAADNAKDAVSELDDVKGTLASLIDEVDELVGYSKYDVDQAMRHVKFVSKLYDMYLNRLDNLIDGNNQYDDKMKFVNLIGLLEVVLESENGQLSFDNSYTLESFYDDKSGFGYKVVKKEVSNG